MSEEQVEEAETTIGLVLEGVSSSSTLINSKMKQADPVTQAKPTSLRTKGGEIKQKLEPLNVKLKAQSEVTSAPKIVSEAKEKIDKMEACMNSCQDAEMPFLKGMEVLPKEESDVALADSDKAAKDTSTALNQAK